MITLLASLALLQATDPAPLQDEAAQEPAAIQQSPEQAPLDRETALAGINAALNSIDTLRSRFIQIAPDGSSAQGNLALSRPGRLRLDYDEPNPLRIIADGTTVAVEDRALETVDRIPLRSTPLWWLLKPEIDIAEDAAIVSLEREFGFLYLTLRDPSDEMEGEIMFVFSQSDHALREWFVTDALGEITRVSLIDVQSDVTLNPRIFVIPEPESRRDSRRGR
ncbi:outer membrane lipoprotein carrier protein LolA [Maricaulis sp.]|jgi:outer membrane lipoprotein-sorting protein|uniref:LolA family protein n=1 Tax=Maricaulis sp. TaxID=1486257 RepID=UPI000C3E8D5C|nr:outer membrane lipoprotein carrier protein LolA [Maricaulis sp.]MAC89437.1 outer-membrane lipoprotein carrier protein LolA [Maricaulis sp.]